MARASSKNTNGNALTCTSASRSGRVRGDHHRPRSNSTTQVYDERFRLVELIDPENKSTTFSYDGGGNRDLITDPNLNTASMTFDETMVD